jgi:hypothetical protein
MAVVATNAAKDWIADKLDGTVATTPGFIGWGTGAGTAAAGDTTLFTEASEARVATTQTQPTSTTCRATATITATGTKTITNAGSFTASSGGTLIIHYDHSGVPVISGDSITYQLDLTIS